MDYIPDLDTFTLWLTNYGSIAIFILLALGIVALPIPEETLMVITGTLIGSGVLHPVSTFIAALAGSICGITLSYVIGRTAGIYFIRKYGKWVGLQEAHVDKVHNWFERFGKWTLSVGYFMPGVRHFTGFVAGTSYLEYRTFALFAYTGGLLWVSTFLSIGYFFGNYCLTACENLEIGVDKIIIFAILFACAATAYLIYKGSKTPTK